MSGLGTLAIDELVRFARFVQVHYPDRSTRDLMRRVTGLAQDVPSSAESSLAGHAPFERFVAIELAFDLWAAAARATKDPGLPVAFAARSRAEDFGVLGLLAMTSASGQEVLAHVIRYNRLVSNAGRWSMHRED
jgi:hypothetical protein